MLLQAAIIVIAFYISSCYNPLSYIAVIFGGTKGLDLLNEGLLGS